MSNDLKSIKDLEGFNFFIPNFQRGYRWTKDEVDDLLNDIENFKEQESSWYCLQPLVVKIDNENRNYIVIDGQQRLTTIYLILKCLGLRDDELFKLNYGNFKEDFFNTLDQPNNENNNITLHITLNQAYIKDAYINILKFFSDKDDDSKNSYKNKLINSSKFIWYEVKETDDEINVFKRLNSGKIPLKKAELVKALFLKRSNFSTDVSDSVYLKQLQIANEWDEIERKLQDDKFWYFISNEKKEDNRIEYILCLATENSDKDIFKYYYNKFNNNSMSKEDVLKQEWEKIKKCYYKLEYWFNDYELHNKIGYLQFIKYKSDKGNIDINFLFKEEITSKKEFRKKIDEYIKEFLNSVITEKRPLSSLTKGENDKQIREILLLHNVLTTNLKEEFFRFDLFKLVNWDIEHIASAGGDSIPSNAPDKNEWVDKTLKYFEEMKDTTFIDRLKTLKDNYDNFEEVFNDINNNYLVDIKEDEINLIKNLVLLDSNTNRSYKNNIFPIKRKEIIELDKRIYKDDKDDKVIKYLLPCTKNVFLKYYSKDSSIPTKWSQKDAEDYLSNLENTLNLEKEENE